MSCRATLAVRRAFLHSVAQCTIVTAFFAFMCSMHKNKLKNSSYFMQFFVRSMNFFLPPQYIVLEPAKMRHFKLKSTIYCGRVKLAFPSKIVYHVRSTASHRTAHTRTGSAVLLRRTASAQRIVCQRVPCQVNNAQSKPLTCTASAQRRWQRVEATSRHSTAHIPQHSSSQAHFKIVGGVRGPS